MDSLKILLPKDEMGKAMKLVPAGHTSLWKYYPDFVDDYIEFEEKSSDTIRGVRDVLRFLIREGNVVSIEQCNTLSIIRPELKRLKRERGWAPVTYNDFIKRLNTYFKWLESYEYIETRKLTKLRKIKEKIKEQYTLCPEDVQKIMMYVFSNENKNILYRWRNIVLLQFFAQVGARPSEILSIQIRDLDIKKDLFIVTIRGEKTKGKPRRYPLRGTILDNLNVYLELRSRRREGLTHLFISCSNKDKPMGRSGLRKLFKEIGYTTGVKMTPSSFRRYVATTLKRNGKNNEQIGDYLGHSRPSTTKRYVAQLPDINDECAMVMHNVLWGPPS